jgi:hypothetical protein
MGTEDGDRSPPTGSVGARGANKLEQGVRHLAASGRVPRAVEMVLSVHGAELFGFLVAVLHDQRQAANVYADASKAMERALGSATWTCSVRTFAYAIVRRELVRHRRLNPGPRRERRLDSVSPQSTRPRRPVAVSTAVAELRRRLADEDRELLILRVDRQLDWEDIAISSLGWDATREALAQEAARVATRVREIRRQLAEAASARRRGSE